MPQQAPATAAKCSPPSPAKRRGSWMKIEILLGKNCAFFKYFLTSLIIFEEFS
jgi:hypothetical protein